MGGRGGGGEGSVSYARAKKINARRSKKKKGGKGNRAMMREKGGWDMTKRAPPTICFTKKGNIGTKRGGKRRR